MINNKGLSLLEVLVALVISGIIMWGSMAAIKFQFTASKRITNSLNKVIEKAEKLKPKYDERVSVGVMGQCMHIAGDWYGKRTDARVVSFYKSSNCGAGYIGTLTALSNPTYDDTDTDTLWNVSGDGSTLRVLVLQENFKPKP